MNYTICKICNKSIKNNQFKRHIEQHNISQQNYYDKFFGIEEEENLEPTEEVLEEAPQEETNNE